MRVRSLDAFRGLTMAGMVIVNNPGDWSTVYAPLLHAEWHGWTPTDLIFPWFLFIMGVAIAQGDRAWTPVSAILRRGATLVAIGLFMAGYPYFAVERWRIPGVLFRLGLCYTAAALVWRAGLSDVPRRTLARMLAAAAACVVAYGLLLAWVAPPGGVAGDLTADGNLGAWLDRTVFGTHLWQRTWDPEGLLSTLPAVGTTLCGVAAGVWLRSRRPASAARALALGGAAGIAIGLAASALVPINKSLWTSSYAVFTAGTAAVALAALHHALDDRRASPALLRVSEPLVALGRNALLLFVVSGLVARTLMVWPVDDGGTRLSVQQWIYTRGFAPLAPPKAASLAYALANLGLLYGLLAWLHRRQWYWRA
jgi:predicted acyltransferase